MFSPEKKFGLFVDVCGVLKAKSHSNNFIFIKYSKYFIAFKKYLSTGLRNFDQTCGQ